MAEPVRERGAMLAGMTPVLDPEAWVFCATDPARDLAGLAPLATFHEDEGVTLILPLDAAREAGFDTTLAMRRITLEVHSTLDGVGLTAAVAVALADAGIACNMVAAFHHDHVFVPAEAAERALAVLQALQAEAATAADREAVVALWEACGLTRPWNDPRADFDQALAGATSTILLAREGVAIAGSVMVGFDGHRGWVYYLAVAPGRRRSGLGKALMAEAEAWLRARGAPKIQLMVREDNDAALGFYEALGLERQKVVTLGRFLTRER